MQLRGISRFRVKEELSLERGYRRVRPDYGCFDDLEETDAPTVNRPRLTQALDRYAEARSLTIDLNQLDPIPDTDLVNFLGVAMPFHPSEKQALLEAGSIVEREKVLVSLLELGGEDPDGASRLELRLTHPQLGACPCTMGSRRGLLLTSNSMLRPKVASKRRPFSSSCQRSRPWTSIRKPADLWAR